MPTTLIRKYFSLDTQQAAALRAAARANGVSESEIVRRAIAAFLDREQGVAASPQLPDEAAWQEILASFAQVRRQSIPGAPQRWKRTDYYDEMYQG